jgi:uncharacterized protein (TIGR00255 family)
MTGYGQSAGENDRYRVSVSLRSVNSRYLDIAVRLRDEHVGSELAVREAVAAELARGRVDVTVEVDALAEREHAVRLRADVLASLQRQLAELVEAGVAVGRIEVRDLLHLPAVVEVEVGAREWRSEDQDLLVEVAHGASRGLAAARAEEGSRLREKLEERLEGLRPLVEELDSRREEVKAVLHANLKRRLEALLGEGDVDPARLAQEAALLVERSDVSEELDRLMAHVEHFSEVCRQEGPVGRRLDFVVQEMVRELNTLGAKCRDAEMSRLVLDGKLLCEQLREQVQNVE